MFCPVRKPYYNVAEWFFKVRSRVELNNSLCHQILWVDGRKGSWKTCALPWHEMLFYCNFKWVITCTAGADKIKLSTSTIKVSWHCDITLALATRKRANGRIFTTGRVPWEGGIPPVSGVFQAAPCDALD